jgi:hypothetical protein
MRETDGRRRFLNSMVAGLATMAIPKVARAQFVAPSRATLTNTRLPRRYRSRSMPGRCPRSTPAIISAYASVNSNIAAGWY